MKTRDKIKHASLDLFLDYGIEGTSTKMILEKSGVSNGSLFNYFPTKDEIVKALYFDIKAEQKAYYDEYLDLSKATRPFIFDFWSLQIKWHLANPRKSLFFEMFNHSAIIRNCSENQTRHLFKDIEDRVQKALDDEEIVAHNRDYFLLCAMNSVRAVNLYLKEYPDDYSDDFIKEAFDQYWRSIVKF